jgi:hypothetical protein
LPHPRSNPERWLLIQRLLRHRYGSRSEKLDLDQLPPFREHIDKYIASGVVLQFGSAQ